MVFRPTAPSAWHDPSHVTDYPVTLRLDNGLYGVTLDNAKRLYAQLEVAIWAAEQSDANVQEVTPDA